MHTHTPLPVLPTELPLRASSVLLWVACAALIACSLMAASAYLYSTLSVGISEYRRHINDGAYKAQLFLDQREAMLRAIAATSVRDDDLPLAPQHDDPRAPQLLPLPLPRAADQPQWQLAVTQRMLGGLELADARLIHTTSAPLRSQVLLLERGGTPQWQELDEDRIPAAMQKMQLPDHARRPVTWLRQPGADPALLAVYSPMDRHDASQGWIGLELHDLEHALVIPDRPQIHYTLLDSEGRVVLRSPDAPRYLAGLQDDYFGIRDEGHLPHDIVLSKSIGTGGLRVLYSVSVLQLLHDARATLIATLLIELGFIALVLVSTTTARRRVIAPARLQHQALLDAVDLNLTLIATAPVGLALVSRSDQSVLRENALARSWIEHDPRWTECLVAQGDSTRRSCNVLDDERIVQITAVPLMYRGRDVCLCVVNDITAQKRTEDSLIQAQRLAENASQEKTRFLATMSHEIRTPLYGITGTLELLDAVASSPLQKQYVALLHQSAAALVSTVNDALDLSRIESGRMELESRPFQLLSLVDDMVGSFIGRAESKGLHLYAVSDVPTDNGVSGDARYIRQILGNLISNAIKFTDSGQIVLRVKAMELPGQRLRVVFQVSDSGSGIEPESISRLFEPYYRAGGALSRNIPGTGLGLAISNQLARLMEGGLHVTSRPGMGTQVSLELVLPRDHDPLRDQQLYPALHDSPIYVSGQLSEVVSNLCKWLSRWGAQAVPCTGAMQQMQPDAILLQAWPPAVNGPLWHGRQVIARPAFSAADVGTDNHVVRAPAHALIDIGWAVHGAQQAADSEAGARSVQTDEPPLLLRVLVVDDSPINQLVVQGQLQMLGCEVALADGGQQALARNDLHGFDVVLTDLNMPGMSGFEFAEALRGKGYRGLILGTSADALPDTSGKWWSAGMDAMLVKPLYLSTLREHLRAMHDPEV